MTHVIDATVADTLTREARIYNLIFDLIEWSNIGGDEYYAETNNNNVCNSHGDHLPTIKQYLCDHEYQIDARRLNNDQYRSGLYHEALRTELALQIDGDKNTISVVIESIDYETVSFDGDYSAQGAAFEKPKLLLENSSTGRAR